MSTVKIHWLRHGEIASHRGNVPLTEEGFAQARERGQLLAEHVSPEETVHFLHAPTLRTRQTVEEVRASMQEALDPGFNVRLLEAREEWAIRNPDIFVAGQRVEMVSSPEAVAEQLTAPSVRPEKISEHPFFGTFIPAPDRIGYWVAHPDPPGEDAVAVARRQMKFAMSLLDEPGGDTVRYVLSTHSPVLRSVVACYIGGDPGEPKHLEPVDLILSNGQAELRFRNERKTVSGTGR